MNPSEKIVFAMIVTGWTASARQSGGMDAPSAMNLPCCAHRPQYLERTLESLAALEGLGAFALYISQVLRPGRSCVSTLGHRSLCM